MEMEKQFQERFWKKTTDDFGTKSFLTLEEIRNAENFATKKEFLDM